MSLSPPFVLQRSKETPLSVACLRDLFWGSLVREFPSWIQKLDNRIALVVSSSASMGGVRSVWGHAQLSLCEFRTTAVWRWSELMRLARVHQLASFHSVRHSLAICAKLIFWRVVASRSWVLTWLLAFARYLLVHRLGKETARVPQCNTFEEHTYIKETSAFHISSCTQDGFPEPLC